MPDTTPHTPAPKISAADGAAARFARDTAGHQMTVLHDDGLYRHLRFMRVVTMPDGKPSKSSDCWFDLVTWPGSLAVNGDCGSFLFSRPDDMFGFFRRSGCYGISPGCWAEKVRAQDRAGVKTYSRDMFRQFVIEEAAEAEADRPGLTAAVAEQIFGAASTWNTDYEDGAREALRDFEFGTIYTAECSCGDSKDDLTYGGAENWAASHRARRDGTAHTAVVKRTDGFTFTDTWEWDLTDYDWQYLWCCHAIQWGVSEYGKQRRPRWWRRSARVKRGS